MFVVFKERTTEREQRNANNGTQQTTQTRTTQTGKIMTIEQKNKCTNCAEETSCEEWRADAECCETCYYETHSQCAGCSDWEKDTDLKSCDNSRSSDEYCESCYDNEHTDCTCCGDSIKNEDSRQCDNYEDYCEDCYYETFTNCESCNEQLVREGCDVRITDDGETFCEDCYNENCCDEWEPRSNWTGCSDYDKIGSSRKFGVELEIANCKGYSSWARDSGWGAKEDGSVYDGMEFVSAPMYGNDGYDSVKDFTKTLRDNDCNVDHKCGFHLHIDLNDCSDGQRKVIALAYHYTRDVWEAFVDESRHDTYYAMRSYGSQHSRTNQFDRKKIIESTGHPEYTDRYTWLNWRSYNKFGTVEVRSHEPTCDGDAVCNWIKAHTVFVDKVREMTVGQVTRLFGSECKKSIMRELRFMWNDAELSDYYGRKSGIGK